MVQTRKSKGKSKDGSKGGKDGGEHEIVDFGEVRARKLEEKRRKTERILFKQMLGIYCVTGEKQMRSIEFLDISEDGCSFQVPFDQNDPWPNNMKELPIRMYFSQDTYLPVQVKIVNSRPSIESEGRFVRYGCVIDKTFSSYPAYKLFCKFLKAYSEHAHQDLGGSTLFYL